MDGWKMNFLFGARQIFSNLMEVLQLFSSGRNGLAGDLCVYLNYFGAVTSPKHTDKVAKKKALVEVNTPALSLHSGKSMAHLAEAYLINILPTLYEPAPTWCTRRGHDDVLVRSVT